MSQVQAGLRDLRRCSGPRGAPGGAQVRVKLLATGIPVHPVTDILPDYAANPAKYRISVVDGHPNALANRLVAEYILTKIIAH